MFSVAVSALTFDGLTVRAKSANIGSSKSCHFLFFNPAIVISIVFISIMEAMIIRLAMSKQFAVFFVKSRLERHPAALAKKPAWDLSGLYLSHLHREDRSFAEIPAQPLGRRSSAYSGEAEPPAFRSGVQYLFSAKGATT
jgi:hypothetical protein